MPARFNWATPTILGNEDPPVLPTDVATKAYVDSAIGTGSEISNGNSSVQVVALDGNVNVAVDGNTVAVFNAEGANIIGNITADNLGNVSTLSLSGNGSQLLYGNGVFANNFGNVSIINLDGNGSNVLRGNGIFSADSGTVSNISNGPNARVDTFISNNHVVFTAGRGNNFTFLHEPGGSIVYFERDLGTTMFIQAEASAPGLNFCDGTYATISGLFPYGVNSRLGDSVLPWASINAGSATINQNATINGTATIATANVTSNLNVLGNIVFSSNIASANINQLRSTTANLTTANVGNAILPSIYLQNNLQQYQSIDAQPIGSGAGGTVAWANASIQQLANDFEIVGVSGQLNGAIRNKSLDSFIVMINATVTWNTVGTGGTRRAILYRNDQVASAQSQSPPADDTWLTQEINSVFEMPPGTSTQLSVFNTGSTSAQINGPIIGLWSAPTSRLNIVILSRRRV